MWIRICNFEELVRVLNEKICVLYTVLLPYLWFYLQEIMQNPISWSISHIFSSKSFRVLALTFNYLTHFELIFVLSKSLTSLGFMRISKFPSTICWQTVLYREWPWHLSQKLFNHMCVYSCTLFHWSMCLSVCQYQIALNTNCIIFKSASVHPPTFFSFKII